MKQRELNLKLINACDDGNIELVKRLIEKGANVNFENDYEESLSTPLTASVNQGNIDIIKLLIKNDVDINTQEEDGSSALHYAVQSGNTNVIKLLIDNNISLNLKDKDGETPIFIAMERGLVKTTNLLIEKGAEIFSVENKENSNPITHAIESGMYPSTLTVENLLNKGIISKDNCDYYIDVANVCNEDISDMILAEMKHQDDCKIVKKIIESNSNDKIERFKI